MFGGIVAFDDLLEARPRADERGDGWDETDTTRFGRLRAAPVGRPARLRGGRRTSDRRRDRVRPFDVCGPLPTGVTVLEASAGTGKTYTIAALAAR